MQNSRRKFIHKAVAGSLMLSAPYILRAVGDEILNFALPQTDSKKEFLNEFSSLYKVKVRYIYYNSFDNFLAQVYKGGSDVDVILSNSFEASILYRHKKLLKIPYAKVQNLQNISHIKNAITTAATYDENYDYNYVLGHTYANLIYRKSVFPQQPPDWGELFPTKPSKVRVAWTSNGKHTVRLASKFLGYGFNNTYKKSLDIVRDLLITSVNFVSNFSEGMNDDLVLNDFADIGMSYTASSLPRLITTKDFANTIPLTGTAMGEAVLVIPTISKNEGAVISLFEFLSTPLINKTMVESSYMATPYPEILKLTSLPYQSNPYIFPKNIDKKLIEPYLDLGDDVNKYIWEIWKQVIKSRIAKT